MNGEQMLIFIPLATTQAEIIEPWVVALILVSGCEQIEM